MSIADQTNPVPSISVERPTANTAVVEQLFGCALRADIDGAMQLMAPDCVVDEPPSLPWGGQWSGRAGFAGMLAAIGAHMSIMEKMKISDAGDCVVARVAATMTAHSSGEVVEMPMVEVFTVRDGQIVHLDVLYKDTGPINKMLKHATAEAPQG